MVYVMDNFFEIYYRRHGRRSNFLRDWHKKHKLTHEGALRLLFGERHEGYKNLWKNWQRKFPADRWNEVVKLVENRLLESASPLDKAILEELQQLLHAGPTLKELRFIVDQAIKSKNQLEVEALLTAVHSAIKTYNQPAFVAGALLEKASNNLAATEEQLESEMVRPEPKGLEIARLERDRKQYSRDVKRRRLELDEAMAVCNSFHAESKRLNAHLLSFYTTHPEA